MSPSPDSRGTVTVSIDGKEVDVPEGTLIIRAAEELGIVIPRFCDHPLLDPVGACRQCMVEVEGAPKPMTACTTACTDGMEVRTHLTSELAGGAQDAVLEYLLINHPLDCPQCDKGGECPLQDQALTHGPPASRYIDHKRRYAKPTPISETIALDRERCVLCARCTRFSKEISGDAFIELFERGALEQVAVYADEPYHSYFSGNIVQICPVGALTATTYRFRSRPFDLRSHDGVCNQCAAGCNLRIDTRRGEVQRQPARANPAVNEEWSCDKGRFGFAFLTDDRRLAEPTVRDDYERQVATSWGAAIERAGEGLERVLAEHGPAAVGVIAGGRLADEDAYAVSRYARDVLGTDNVDFRTRPRTDDELGVLAGQAGRPTVTYDEVEAADLVVVAGLDAEEEVPILHLRLRKAWRRGQRIVVVGPALGSAREIAWRWVRTPAGGEAAALEPLASGEGAGDELADLAAALRDAERPVVLAGERLALSPGALPAAARLAEARDAGFAWVPRRPNARGALDAGLLPGLLPGGRRLEDPGPVADAWPRLPDRPGLDTSGMLRAAAAGEIRALHLIGADPARDAEDPELARRALEAVDLLVVQDLLPTDSARPAHVVLPARAAQERVGSFTSWEGRRQPFAQAVEAPGSARPDWEVLRHVARRLGRDPGWRTADELRDEAAPLMRGAGRADPAPERAPAPPPPAADGRLHAVVVDRLLPAGAAMLAGADELLATAPREEVLLAAADADRAGLVDGAEAEVAGPHGSVRLPVRVTDDVVEGAVVLPGPSAACRPGELWAGHDPTGGPLEVGVVPAADEADERGGEA